MLVLVVGGGEEDTGREGTEVVTVETAEDSETAEQCENSKIHSKDSPVELVEVVVEEVGGAVEREGGDWEVGGTDEVGGEGGDWEVGGTDEVGG